MSDHSNEAERQLFADLKVLSDSAFPKQCSTCGRVYNSPEDFFNQSSAPPFGSGLKGSRGENDESIVELFRNCGCGSTLMDFFMDRRDSSPWGVKRRTVFGRLLDALENNNLPRNITRQELTGVLNGDPSRRLEALGIQLKTKGN